MIARDSVKRIEPVIWWAKKRERQASCLSGNIAKPFSIFVSLTVIEERLTQRRRRRILNAQNRSFILCIKMRPFKARAEIASGGNATFCVLTRMHERAITNNKKHIVAVYRSEKKKKNHTLIVTHLLRRQKHFLVDRNNHEEFSRSFRFYRGAITPRRDG